MLLHTLAMGNHSYPIHSEHGWQCVRATSEFVIRLFFFLGSLTQSVLSFHGCCPVVLKMASTLINIMSKISKSIVCVRPHHPRILQPNNTHSVFYACCGRITLELYGFFFLKVLHVACWNLHVPCLAVLPFKPSQTNDKNTTSWSISQRSLPAFQSGKFG